MRCNKKALKKKRRFFSLEAINMRDKLIGITLLICSLGITAFMFLWTILFPILRGEEFLFEAYLAIAIIIFIAIFIMMLLVSWVGWNFLKSRAPKEIVIDELEE